MKVLRAEELLWEGLRGHGRGNVRHNAGFWGAYVLFQKKILERKLNWQTTTCYILWETVTVRGIRRTKGGRIIRSKVFLGVSRGTGMGKEGPGREQGWGGGDRGRAAPHLLLLYNQIIFRN